MARIPRQHFSKIFQQTSAADLANSRLIFARFPRQGGRTARPYSRAVQQAVQQAIQQYWARKSRQLGAVSYSRVLQHFWHEFRGRTVAFIVVLAQISRWSYSCIYCRFLGTQIEKSVQHLLLFLFCCLCVFRGGDRKSVV